jgi:transcriptional regulator with XRE-family HTH domain
MRSVAMEELAAATSPRRMSQSELAGELGMTPQVVSKWVNGLSRPDSETRLKIERVLGIAASDWDREARASQVPPKKTRKPKRNPKPRRAA